MLNILSLFLYKPLLVVPIHKKGPKLDYTNYRPISVLPITSLLLERHVNLHLKAYLELNSLFYFRQSGFREHHSCQTALIKMIGDWLSLLIHKLKLYNIDTSWFSTYLYKRFQQTHYAGAISDKKEVISGVPQGSLGQFSS